MFFSSIYVGYISCMPIFPIKSMTLLSVAYDIIIADHYFVDDGLVVEHSAVAP